MLRRVLAIAVFPLLAPGVLNGQETQATRTATLSTTAAEVVMVNGLANDDLLNIRIKASPLGKVVGRLANGATVRRHECETVRGYEWCRVDAIEKEGLSGWAPARYLHSLGLEDEASVASVEPAAAPEVSPAKPAAGEPANVPIPTPSPRRAPAEPAAVAAAVPESAEKISSAAAGEPADAPVPVEVPAGGPAGTVADAAEPAAGADEAPNSRPAAKVEGPRREPEASAVEVAASWSPGLEARFAGEPAAAKDAPAAQAETPALAFAPAPTPEAQEAPEARPADAARTAPDAAVSPPPDLQARFDAPPPDLAATDGARTALLPANEPAPPAAGGEAEIAAAKAAPAEVAALVPTPRPGPEEEVDKGDPNTVGEVKAEQPAAVAALPASKEGPPASAEAVGEIPCARYVGQPMTRCEVRVARIGEGDADVTIAWPDGGTRTIHFRDGAPQGSNSRGEFRFTREGTLNMIRIGVSERFEIVDELSYGG